MSSKAAYEFTKDQINPDALTQSVDWFDRHGRQHKIENMSRQHCYGAMKKLFGQFGSDIVTTPLFASLSKQAKR